MRVIVVGSGLAGLSTAITATELGHEVVVLTKSRIDEANTAYAQGGIAAAVGGDDSVELHAADTMRAGALANDPSAVRVLTTDGEQIVRELLELGVQFDRDEFGGLERGKEAAHSMRRVFHAGGDATGAEIERAEVAATQRRNIPVREYVAVADLLVQDGRVVGVETLDASGVRGRLTADAVVLASGGAGQLYRFTTNPTVATGDGIAAAARAGAVLHDMEFVQFHPTALAAPGVPLISEAVRGDGAVLRNRAGDRFMLDVHPDAELAPRDVVARAIAREMAAQDGQPIWLDATVIEPHPIHGQEFAELRDFLAVRFPTIDAECRAAGFDWAREWIPVTPAAHYLMGGIATDLDGRSSLPGLWAVGEVANTGVHGANRLASNSLLEAAVFGRRAALALGRAEPSRRFQPQEVEAGPGPLTELRAAPGAAAEPEQPASAPFTRDALQALMWDQLGLVRNEAGMRAAAAQLVAWREALANTMPASIRELEDRNLLEVAAAVTAAARARTQSLGAHFRSDAPDSEVLPNSLSAADAPHAASNTSNASNASNAESLPISAAIPQERVHA